MRATTRRRTPTTDRLIASVLAGLAGSAALNLVTYTDMALRGRPTSSTPDETVRRLAEIAHLALGPEDRAANRRAGLGPLLGYLSGVSTAVGYAVLVRRRMPLPLAATLLGLGALVGSDTPMALLRVTDPRAWSVTDWISDLVPHLAYGAVAAATLERS